MKCMKRAFGEPSVYHMTLKNGVLSTSKYVAVVVVFCSKKCIVYTDGANDVYALKCNYTYCHTIFTTRRYPFDNSDAI